jgi:hypothetical protein
MRGNVSMIRALVLLCTVGTIVPAMADGPIRELKGVTIVRYQLIFDQPNTGVCAIDWNAWNTAIDFVANQSTNLKLIREVDHNEQLKQFSDELRAANENFWRIAILADEAAKKKASEAVQEAEQRWTKFVHAPSLYISILTRDVGNGCVGMLSAEASVAMETTKIIATDRSVGTPYLTIWKDPQLLSGPYATFSSFAIRTSEQIMKSFVNDWAKSQE